MEWQEGAEDQDLPSPQLVPGDDSRRLSEDRVTRAGMEGWGVRRSDTSLPLGGSEEGRPELAAATARACGLVKVVKRDRMDLCKPAPSLLERDLVLPLLCVL